MQMSKNGVLAGEIIGRDTPNLKSAILVTGAMVGLALGFAGLYFSTLGVFLKPISVEFGWGRAEASTIILFSLLGNAVGAPLLGLLIDRIGAVRLVLASALAFSAGLYAFSILPSSKPLFAFVSFALGALASGTGPAGYLASLQRSFDRRLGLALSFAMAGLGIGAALLPSMTQGLVASSGWRAAYQALALMALAGGLCAAALITWANPPAAPAESNAAGTPLGVSLGVALRDWRFWVLGGAMFLGTCAGLGATVHAIALLTDRGVSPIDAARVAGVSGIGLMLGRLGSGMLMDVVFAPIVGAAGFVLGALGLIVLASEVSAAFPVLAAAACLFGMALGAEGDFAAFAVRRYFGTRAFASIYGAIFTLYALGGIVGPTLFGLAFDKFGGYGVVLTVAAGAYVISAAALLTLGPYRWTRSARA